MSTRSMRTPIRLALALLLLACDRGTGAAPTAGAAPATVAATPTAAPVAATPVAAPARPPARASARERARAGFDAGAAGAQARIFREQRDAGRKAVQQKRHADGVAAFTAALAIDPNDAATLAELGWAAYLAGDLASAQRHTERAIAGDASDRTRGAALYNLGRILEDRGERDGAAAAYRRSLQLRPNDVVQGRLAALTGAGADASGHDCDIALRPGRPAMDVCAALVAGMPADEVFSSHRCDEQETAPGEVVVDAAGTPAGGEPSTIIDLEIAGGIRVAHFRVESWLESGGSSDEVYLALLYDDRWYLAELGSAYNPGVGYIGESFTVDSVAANDLIPGGRPEVVVTLSTDRHDGDYGDNTTENDSSRLIAVLGLDGDAPRWLGAFTVSQVHETGPMLEGEPPQVAVVRTERSSEYRFDTASGEVELTAVTGHEPASPPGRFKLGALPAACPRALGYVAGG